MAQVDVAETRGKEHGRKIHRRLQATTRLSGCLNWPGLAQVCRLTRVTARNAVETTEIHYAITSVPRSLANASQLLAWWQGHWGIENRVHYVRDVAFGEDACRVRTGRAPQNLAAVRNAIISLLRMTGCCNI